MKILNLLSGVEEIAEVATKSIDCYSKYSQEQRDLINNEIVNYDLVIVSKFVKNDYFKDNDKIISGREFVKNIKYYFREEK